MARRHIAAFAAAAVRGDARGVLATHDAAATALETLGQRKAAAQLRLARANALVATDGLEAGLQECARVREEAARASDADLDVAALACATSLVLAAGQRDRGRALYLELAVRAEHAGDLLLAAHALRAAAALAKEAGDPAAVAAALERAMALGERARPHEVASGPFTATARDLAALCRAHGLASRADDASRRASRLEQIARAAFATARRRERTP